MPYHYDKQSYAMLNFSVHGVHALASLCQITSCLRLASHDVSIMHLRQGANSSIILNCVHKMHIAASIGKQLLLLYTTSA